MKSWYQVLINGCQVITSQNTHVGYPKIGIWEQGLFLRNCRHRRLEKLLFIKEMYIVTGYLHQKSLGCTRKRKVRNSEEIQQRRHDLHGQGTFALPKHLTLTQSLSWPCHGFCLLLPSSTQAPFCSAAPNEGKPSIIWLFFYLQDGYAYIPCFLLLCPVSVQLRDLPKNLNRWGHFLHKALNTNENSFDYLVNNRLCGLRVARERINHTSERFLTCSIVSKSVYGSKMCDLVNYLIPLKLSFLPLNWQ